MLSRAAEYLHTDHAYPPAVEYLPTGTEQLRAAEYLNTNLAHPPEAEFLRTGTE